MCPISPQFLAGDEVQVFSVSLDKWVDATVEDLEITIMYTLPGSGPSKKKLPPSSRQLRRAADERPEQEEEEPWLVGDEVQVFSNSADLWLTAKVTAVDAIVRYLTPDGQKAKKQLPTNHAHLRAKEKPKEEPIKEEEHAEEEHVEKEGEDGQKEDSDEEDYDEEEEEEEEELEEPADQEARRDFHMPEAMEALEEETPAPEEAGFWKIFDWLCCASSREGKAKDQEAPRLVESPKTGGRPVPKITRFAPMEYGQGAAPQGGAITARADMSARSVDGPMSSRTTYSARSTEPPSSARTSARSTDVCSSARTNSARLSARTGTTPRSARNGRLSARGMLESAQPVADEQSSANLADDAEKERAMAVRNFWKEKK